MSKALLYDATVCIGCKQCEAGCATQNNLPYDDAVGAEQTQSEHKFTVVLAKGEKFMSIGAYQVSDDGRYLAYSTDVTGFRQYTLQVKDLVSGDILPERVEKTSEGFFSHEAL